MLLTAHAAYSYIRNEIKSSLSLKTSKTIFGGGCSFILLLIVSRVFSISMDEVYIILIHDCLIVFRVFSISMDEVYVILIHAFLLILLYEYLIEAFTLLSYLISPVYH